LHKTILFAETEERRRQSLSVLLNASGYHLIVAFSGKDALQKALEFKGPIHLLLANVEMPEMTGSELAQRLNRQRPDMKVFLISGRDSGMFLLNHGWQFLPAPFASDLLRTRIAEILKKQQRTSGHSPHEDGRRDGQGLTKREIQVLKLIAEGNSTKQLAAVLGISFKTSVGHRSRLMKKLNIHDSATLVRYAIRMGLIDP